jgi:DNA-binding NtrC family response regulator
MDSKDLSVPGAFCDVSLAQFGSVPARLGGPARSGGGQDQPGTSSLVGRTIGEVEREMIIETLTRTDGNKTAAAELLGVTPRTLRNKLSRYRSEGIPTVSVGGA